MGIWIARLSSHEWIDIRQRGHIRKRNSPKSLCSISLLCEKTLGSSGGRTWRLSALRSYSNKSHHQYPETGSALFGTIAVPGNRGATFGIQNYTYPIPLSVCLSPLILDLAVPPYIVKARSIISMSLAHHVFIQYKVTQTYNMINFPQKWHAVVSAQCSTASLAASPCSSGRK